MRFQHGEISYFMTELYTYLKLFCIVSELVQLKWPYELKVFGEPEETENEMLYDIQKIKQMRTCINCL